MPIISLQIIKKPRKSRRCFQCFKYLEGETIRIYGMAERGDTPYACYVHRECLYSRDALQKLAAVEHRVQRTAIAASQQASFITDGNLPSKARGVTRRRSRKTVGQTYEI